MSWLFIIIHLVPLYRTYQLYSLEVKVRAAIIYTRKRRTKKLRDSREDMTHEYLTKSHMTFLEYINKARKHGRR